MKKLLFLLSVLLIINTLTNASHLMGGEITWECQSNGNYIFTLKLYRDCNGANLTGSQSLSVYNHPNLFSIPLTPAPGSPQDVSPTGVGCTNCSIPGPGSAQEFIFVSGDINLGNTSPPPQGWIFAYCNFARNIAINNLFNAGNQSLIIRSVMYSHSSPCFDSSPYFSERPAIVVCTRDTFTLNNNTIDNEYDSLHYEWGQPLGSPGSCSPTLPPPLTFSPPYTYNNPLPPPSLNPNNVSAMLNSLTGEITFTSFTTGAYVIVVKVTAFKCGIKVAEIFRDIQITLLDCIISPGPPVVFNTSPDVNAPFVNPSSGLFEWYSDTVNAGDLVQFSLNAFDFEFNSNNSPQIVTVNASASQFGSGFTDPNSGCLIPPCATLLPPAPTSAVAGVAMYFEWQTDCSHVLYDSLCSILGPETFNFNFSVKDDFCPANGMENAVITIVVNPGPLCNPVSTDDMEIYSGINIFPFSESEIVVEILMKDYTIADLYITDMQGRTLKLMDINGFPGKNSLKIFTKDITPGVYFLQLKTSNSIVSKKFALIK